VLFDAWYPSKHLLKRIRDYGWYVVCRLKKNRRFNGRAVRADRRHHDWTECGWLTGGLNVLVVRYGAKYYATHRLTLPAAAVRRLYGIRAQIEVCQTQPVKLAWCPPRCVLWMISDLRGFHKREHVGDIHVVCCHDHFTNQALGNHLALLTREPVQVVP
jgi:hypothetical protein